MDDPTIARRHFTPEREARTVLLPRVLRELFGYGIASAAALGLDIIILKVLVNHFNWHYLPAATLSFVSGCVLAYWLSLQLAFRSRRITNPAMEFACFAALGLVGVVVNGGVISIGVRTFGLTLLHAKLAAAVCTFATNFCLRKALLFSPKSIQS